MEHSASDFSIVTLASGTSLGPYEILAPIGAGGMGEVYQARDTRLDRNVAIKVLPHRLANDEALRKRFELEARAVSQLNHPNICTLHDVGHQDGVDFLVMELLEGETLAERLKKGALPIETALGRGTEIASALDAAHRRGIVHRDLKPGNVFLTRTGAKLLDFGLAKLRETEVPQELSSVATQQRPLTEKGAVLGTFQYMAPEQLEGDTVDARTDIFAFGALLYEMLTGRKAFAGKTQASLIGAILHSDPSPVSELLPMAPPALDRLTRKCLAKDPDARWQSARDLEDELGWIAGSDGSAEPTRVTENRASRLAPAIGFALAGAVVASLFWALRESTPPPSDFVRRSVIELPPGETLISNSAPNLTISSNGTTLAFRTGGDAGTGKLFVRRLDTLEPRLASDELIGPRLRFSPDGQWVGFARPERNGLSKVSIRDGTVVAVAEGVRGVPFDWHPDGRIVATSLDLGLVILSDEGGALRSVTTRDRDAGTRHLFPQFLPSGREVLFTIRTGDNFFEDTRIAVVSLESGDVKVIQEGGTFARYVPSRGTKGHLLFARPGTVFAAPFDPEALELEGPAAPVLRNVQTMQGGMVDMAYADDGTLVYAPSSQRPYERSLVEMDLEGRETILGERLGFAAPVYAPDGSRIAVSMETEAESDIVIYDRDRGTLTPVTFEGQNLSAVWSPDGSRLAFASDRDGTFNLYARPADPAGTVVRLTASDNRQIPFSWSPDGRFLAFVEIHPETSHDIWMLPMDGEGVPEPYATTSFAEDYPAFSPDGRWIAYASDQTGQPEIWVRAFRGDERSSRVSDSGGGMPVWSTSGDRLYYVAQHRLMSVDVATVPAFLSERPLPLIDGVPGYYWTQHGGTELLTYDVSPDGSRFITTRGVDSPDRLHLVTNWFAELRELAPPRER